MNLTRVANINIFRNIRQLETLTKNGNLFARTGNPVQLPKSSSSFAILNNRVATRANNYPKYGILSKLSVQVAVGTTQARAASTHGDHVRLWMIERLVSVSFLAIIPAAFFLESKIIDTILAAAIVMHTHWGLEAVILDYARPIILGKIIPKVAFFALNLVSIATLAGLLVLIYNGPGLAKIIKQGWAVGSKSEQKAD